MAYSPASNTLLGNTDLRHNFTAGNPALYIHYYRTKGLDTLKKKFVFGDVVEEDDIPRQSGNTIQWFRYRNLAANPTPLNSSTEGTVGTALKLQSDVITATLSQYVDYVTFSDRLIFTAIDEGGIVESAVDNMSYRAAFTLDTITRNEIDSVASADRSGSLLGTEFSIGDARKTRAYLQGRDVQPMQKGSYKGFFCGILHPYVTFDIVNDPSAAAMTDLLKYTENNPFEKMEDRGNVFNVSGVTFKESTNVLITPGSPAKYRTYIFGNGGIGGATLNPRKPTKVSDPTRQRFNLMIKSNLTDSVANPTATIGGYVSYNFMYVAKVLTDTMDETVPRYAYFDAPTGVS